MTKAYCDTTFGYRFLALTENEFSLLRSKLPKVQFTARQRQAGLVVSFDLDVSFELGPLLEFIEEAQPSENMRSVWVSVTSSSDQGGVSLPAHVLAVIRKTSSNVDFLFSACLEETN